MPSSLRHVLSVHNLTPQQVTDVFSLAADFKASGFEDIRKKHAEFSSKVVALVFLEPSTRTRMSFEIAALRLGMKTTIFSADKSTSMAKGETAVDTLRTIVAMDPDLMVVRHGLDVDASAFLARCPLPYINGGDGKNEHPTQALLDAFTVRERRGDWRGERLLFVGDVEHSRVAHSDCALFRLLGAEIGYCAPAEWRPQSEEWKTAQSFSTLRSGLEWATVCMGLRIQFERHSQEISQRRRDEIVNEFALTPEKLKHFKADGLIMHPGPFIPGVDLVPQVLQDPRCAIYDQVRHGVYVRAALMAKMLGL